MLDNFTYPADIFPTDRFYNEDLTGEQIELTTNESGIPSIQVLSTPPEPIEARLKRVTIQSCDLHS